MPSSKFTTKRDNKIPVYAIPGKYYVNIHEPESTPNFSICASTATMERAAEAIRVIAERFGGTLGSVVAVYGMLWVENVPMEAVEAICELPEVSRIGPEVSFLPPASYAYYKTGEGEPPPSFVEDVLEAAAYLHAHGCLFPK